MNDRRKNALNEAHLVGDLGGRTLASGTYEVSGDLIIKEGNLILDAEGNETAFWIFHIGANVRTVGGFGGNVLLEGNALAKNIYWFIGESIDIGDGTSFQGNVFTRSVPPAGLVGDIGYKVETGHATTTAQWLAKVPGIGIGRLISMILIPLIACLNGFYKLPS
jgi:hypothetical protein